MANSAIPLAVLVLSLLAVGTSARPCKTLFFFSATTTTTAHNPFNSLPQNPNSGLFIHNSRPRYFTIIFPSTAADRFPERSVMFDEEVEKPLEVPLGFYPSLSSSIRDRSKDIMSVVGALLFGVGCGALTATVMYFFWAMFSLGRFDFGEVSSSSDDDDDDDIAAAKKKLGYVVIPAQPKVVDDDLKKTAPATETV